MNLDEFIRRFLGRFFLGVKADFNGLEVNRPIITVVSRLMSNHTRVKANLNRIKIVTKAVCGCGKDYWTGRYTTFCGAAIGIRPNGCNSNHSYREKIFLCVPDICWLFVNEII
jgi:hypothetical protein